MLKKMLKTFEKKKQNKKKMESNLRDWTASFCF